MQVSHLGYMRKKVKESPDKLDDFQRRGTGEPPTSIWNVEFLVQGCHELPKYFTLSSLE